MTDVRTAQVFGHNKMTQVQYKVKIWLPHSHDTEPELYQPPRISCQTNKQKKPATAFDFKYHGVTVTAVCFLTFAEKVFSVCCSASFQHVVTTRKRSCSPLNEISDSNRVDTIKSTFFFPGSEAWPYSHPPPPQKSTPPHLLYSQLAYGDETVCVGGGTDEVGGPLCVSASVCVRAIGSVCVGGGLRSRSLERRDRGRLFQPAVSSRHRTAHCQPN